MDLELHSVKNENTQKVEEKLLAPNPAVETTKSKKFKNSLIAYILVIISALALCLSFILNKVAFLLNPLDQLIIRYSFQLFIGFIICKYNNLSCFGKKNERKLLAIRVMIGVIIASSTLIAMRLVHPSDCTTIVNASVILTAIVCRIFIKEKITIVHIVAVLLAVLGIVCIFRPTFLFSKKESFSFNSTTSFNHTVEAVNSTNTIYNVIGIIIALVAAFTFALSNLYMKILSNAKVHFAIVAIYPSMLSLPFMIPTSLILIFTKITYKAIRLSEIWLHILYSCVGGFFGAFGILLLSLIFKYEDASKIAIVKTIDVFFSFLFQYLLLNIKIDLMGILGAVLILSGTFSVIFFKIIENNNQNPNKFFKFLNYKF